MDTANAPQAAVPDDAAWLIDLIAGNGLVTFQTFDDAKSARKGLTRVLHGSLPAHATTLASLNARGAGIYFMVNEGDGKGRKAGNVRRVRALFADLDGAPLGPVLEGPLKPHITVESSPGRFHAYWLVTGLPLEDFRGLQTSIAKRFGGDPVVKDLPRVMRLPGYEHLKREPFVARVVDLHRHARYSAQHVRDAFAAPATDAPLAKQTLPEKIGEGERNNALFGLARGLVNKGFGLADVNRRLQRTNAERCDPPLCATEVDAIVVSACANGSSGYTAVPHAVLDSPKWKALHHGARSIVIAAYRQFNGQNDGNLSLAWDDFKDEFAKKQFYELRKRAIRAGFIQVARQHSYSKRGGKVPDLFRLGVLRTPNQES